MPALRIAAFVVFVGLASGAAVAVTEPTCTWQDCDKPCDGGNRECARSDGQTWIIPCHVQNCAEVVGCGNADIVFVIDSSTSIGEQDWWKTKQFVIDVSKGLKIGPQESKVAMVTYSSVAEIRWTLNAFTSMDELETQIWDLEWMKGNTNTYQGLSYAEQIIDAEARQYLKHIVIVITDGKSNIDSKLLIPKAESMHDKGIEIFCVGVTDSVDKTEVDGIASIPKDVHAHYVTDYSALVQITNTLIIDTCEAASRVECDPWSKWSDCVVINQNKNCGPGISSRARKCRIYLYDGAVPEVRIHTEHRQCDESCDRCARCSYDVNGVGYLAHDNCHQFIQCEYFQGKFIEHEMNCGALFWRQSILSCDRKHDDGYQCTDRPVFTEKFTTAAFECDMDPHATNPALYIRHLPTHDVEMRCPPGTIFDAHTCRCIHGSGNDKTCNSDAMLEFPFNSNTDDICNRAAGTRVGNVTLVNGAAYFDGNSKVQIGYLNNYFAEHAVTAMTISLWFRYTGNDDAWRGLFSNGDCVDEASLLVGIGDSVAQGQILTETSSAVFDNSAATRAVQRDEWVFATLVYSGWDAKYYINGVQQSSIVISGNIANTQCDTTVGFSGQKDNAHYFQGFIDDVRVYKKTLWDFDITTLYNNGRQ